MPSFAVILASSVGRAAGLSILPVAALGPHQRIMLFKKNENPQNIMVIYTKTDANCNFAISAERPVLDFYWLMDGTKYKPVHPLIKLGIQDRLELDVTGGKAGKSSFFVNINDLGQVRHDLDRPRVLVRSIKKESDCEVEAIVSMGPSDHQAVVRLDEIDANTETTFWPPFRRVTAITLSGVNAKTGQKFSRTFSKR